MVFCFPFFPDSMEEGFSAEVVVVKESSLYGWRDG